MLLDISKGAMLVKKQNQSHDLWRFHG